MLIYLDSFFFMIRVYVILMRCSINQKETFMKNWWQKMFVVAGILFLVGSAMSHARPAWRMNDYNGDGISDLAVHHTEEGNWYIVSLGSTNPIVFGQNWGPNMIPVMGDYDGDGIGDLAAYNPNNYEWYIRSMGPGDPILFGQKWGAKDAIPVPGDYNGDGFFDIAFYVEGRWFIKSLTNPYVWPIRAMPWGSAGQIPVPGDYNGDGRWDLAVYDTSSGNWFISSLWNDAPITFGQNWGSANTIPVPGDYNGDGVWDLGVFEPGTGKWFIRSLGAGDPIVFGQEWGNDSMSPVPGDYDGNGCYDLALRENDTGNWFIRSLGPGEPITYDQNWGNENMTAVGQVTVEESGDHLPIKYPPFADSLLWKPVAHSGHALIVLLPSSYLPIYNAGNLSRVVISRDPAGENLVTDGEGSIEAPYEGLPAVRWPHSGADYAAYAGYQPVYLVIILANGTRQPYYIPDASQRWWHDTPMP
jgi:hypothetical protein